MRHGQDRRSEIKTKAVLFLEIQFAANVRVFLIQSNRKAVLSQGNGAGDTTQAATDDKC